MDQLNETLRNIRYLSGKNYCKYNEQLKWWECKANPTNQINCKYADNKKKCISCKTNKINPLLVEYYSQEAIDNEIERNK